MSSREVLYESYGAHPSHADAVRGEHEALDPVYRHHLRSWLPEDLDAPILDFGCGDGYLLGFLARHGFRTVVGVDRSNVQIERARLAAPAAELHLGQGVEVLEGNPGRFGAIFALDVLEHLTRDELFEFMPRVARALRPGGVFVARVPNADSPFHASIRYGDLTHEIGFAPPALVHVFRVNGFDSIELRESAPVARGAKSRARAVLWQLLRQFVRLWNLIETGSGGAGVYTRIVYVRGRYRPPASRSSQGLS